MLNKPIYAVQLWRFPGVSAAALKQDMQLYKDNGFNAVRIQQLWSMDEPTEGKVEPTEVLRILDAADEVGIDVLVTITYDNAPMWLYRKYPDAYHITASGRPYFDHNPYPLPYDGKPGPCFDHPGVRADAENFVREFVRQVGHHPRLVGWSAWQEAALWTGELSGDAFADKELCFCGNTLAHFRRWARDRYNTLEDLNRRWMTNYTDWNDIEPPRHTGMLPSGFDWQRFMTVRMGFVAGWKCEAIRSADPKKRPINIHMAGSMQQNGIRGWTHDYQLAKRADYFGNSLYPGWFGTDPLVHQEYVSFVCDTTRAAHRDKPFWAAEIQAGRIGLSFFRGPIPTDRDFLNWIAATLGAGGKSMVFWSNREEVLFGEAFGFGMLDRFGKPKPWFPAIAKTLQFLNRHAALIQEAEVEPSSVGIVLHTDSYITAHVGKRNELAIDSMKKLHANLLSGGIYPDFLWTENIGKEDWSGYKAIFLPFAMSMTAALAEKLKSYVGSGGTLISEACPAQLNEYGIVLMEPTPGYGLSSVFGGTEQEVFAVQADAPVVMEGIGSFGGLSLGTQEYIQTYRVNGGEPIFLYDREAVGLKNKYGNGMAYLLGTLVNQALGSSCIHPVYERLLAEAGIAVPSGVIRSRSHTASNGREIRILFNASESTASTVVGDDQEVLDYFSGKLHGNTITLEPFSSAILVLASK